MEKDILEILEDKSDEAFITSSKKLIKKLSKNENQEEINKIKEETKKEIDKLLENKFHRVKEIYNNGIIDEEKLEFALKLINKDEKIYNEITEIKNKKEREKKIKDLAEIKEHIQKTINNLRVKIERINSKNYNKEKQSILKKLIKKDQTKDELEEQLEEIINVIEESKSISENKELKDNYLSKIGIREIVDILYKKCSMKDIEGIQEIGITLQKKYKEATENIDTDLNKLKNTTVQPKKYDDRLVDYVYNKPKNYIAHTIEHSEKNQMYTHLLTILKLINDIEKKNKKIKNIRLLNNQLKGQRFKLDKTKVIELKEKVRHIK